MSSTDTMIHSTCPDHVLPSRPARTHIHTSSKNLLLHSTRQTRLSLDAEACLAWSQHCKGGEGKKKTRYRKNFNLRPAIWRTQKARMWKQVVVSK